MTRNSYRIGIDVGGTFTKAALIDNLDGRVVGRSSVHTTHDHPDGVAAGVIEVFERVLGDAGVDAADVVLLAHSTTQATNALLEGDVARVGILGLAGARAAKLAEEQVRIDPIELAPGRVLHTCNRFLLSDGARLFLLGDGARLRGRRRFMQRAIDRLIPENRLHVIASLGERNRFHKFVHTVIFTDRLPIRYPAVACIVGSKGIRSLAVKLI